MKYLSMGRKREIVEEGIKYFYEIADRLGLKVEELGDDYSSKVKYLNQLQAGILNRITYNGWVRREDVASEFERGLILIANELGIHDDISKEHPFFFGRSLSYIRRIFQCLSE